MKKIDLSGTWEFCLDQEMKGITEEYYRKEFKDSIELPNTTALAQKGSYNKKKEIGFLTEEYPFTGVTWYSKTLQIETKEIGKTIKLFLERTRISKVWINGEFVGSQDSLCTPHEYDITKFVTSATIHITIAINNKDYVTKGGHLTSPDTQTNWNGIVGKIELRIYPDIYIQQVQAYPNMEKGVVLLKYNIVNTTNSVQEICVHMEGNKNVLGNDQSIETEKNVLKEQIFNTEVLPGENMMVTTYFLTEYDWWSEYSPVYYELAMSINDDDVDIIVPFGMRNFEAKGHYFYINGLKTFLRGKHDGMIFPLTGAAPMETEEWIRIMSIAKSYGINHYRYHTCCPPEAAFVAADLLGIYMEPELPFWGSLVAPGEDGYNEEEQAFLIKEGDRMLSVYGNHPSFVMMSLGNELWGSAKQMAKIISRYKGIDKRHLYTEGSNNFQFTPVILEEDDFFVGVRFSRDRLIRGSYAMCDAPLGFVQTDEPNSLHNYDHQIIPDKVTVTKEDFRDTHDNEEIEIQFGTGTKKVKAAESVKIIPDKPVISHEIGQYAVFPDFKEIEKYKGPLKARNFEVFRERMEEKGLLDLAEEYFLYSGKLAVDCYKLELEAAHRSKYMAGYQILDIQDFSGQGTALVGILDAFMDSKGLVRPEEWRGYCSDAVLMAGFESFNLKSGQEVTSDLCISYYRPKELLLQPLIWQITDGDEVVSSGQLDVTITEVGVQTIGSIKFRVPDVTKTRKCILSLAIPQAGINNSYELYVHPSDERYDGNVLACLTANEGVVELTQGDVTLYIVSSLENAKSYLMKGERVLLLPKLSEDNSIEGQYSTDFWCYPMFRGISEWMKKPIPVGTMGLLVQKEHPCVKYFAVEPYSTPQWYHIVMASRLAILDETPHTFRPIVQMMDNFERNHKLGLLFESKVYDGRLLVCTSDLSKIINYTEVKQFASNIVEYCLSEEFMPAEKLLYSELVNILV